MRKITIFIFAIITTVIIQNKAIAQFNFVHITDLHVADSYCAGDYDLDGEMFVQLRNEINNLNPKPAFVVATGDISHVGGSGTDGMYAALTQHLYPDNVINPDFGAFFMDSLLTIPIYFDPGNHDFRTGNVPPLSDENLTEYTNIICSSSDYFFIHQNALVICMNSGYDDLRPLWDDTNYMSPEGSGFTNEQCTWLSSVLENNIYPQKIITMHHPTVNEIGVWCDGSTFSGTILDNADGSIKYNRTTFLDICDSNNVDIVLAGHAHQNVVVDRNGNIVDENWQDSTRYIQTGAALYGCYRIITVDSLSVLVSDPQNLQSTEIAENLSTKELHTPIIYPNPSNGVFTVEGKNIQSITILNISGQIVYFVNDLNSLNKHRLDLSNMPKGLYYFKIQTTNFISIEKALKI